MFISLSFLLTLSTLFLSTYFFVFTGIFFLVLSVVFSSYYCSYSYSSVVLSDELSLFMTFMLLCVVFFSLFMTLRLPAISSFLFLCVFMISVCYLVFRSNNLLLLYISYEISLIPIILIIIVWGSYPERSLRSLMLLLYTSVFTIPFMYVLFYVSSSYNTFSFIFFSESLPSLFSFIVFSVFAVKLPIYGLHFWLPIAHVEAPTFGSIILAGVLLKLGGVGLIRCYNLVCWPDFFSYSFSYFVIFLVYVTLVCCFQSDFKRLVAYSSVSHMIVSPILLISFTTIGYKSLILVLLFHGFRSPVLFSIVGYIYSVYSTRQLLSIRGVLLASPVLSLIIIFAFMFRLCVPPFPSYVSEVMFFISCINSWLLMPLLLLLFRFLSLVYNLNWLSSILFSSTSSRISYSSFHMSYCYFYCVLMMTLLGFVFVPLFSLI